MRRSIAGFLLGACAVLVLTLGWGLSTYPSGNALGVGGDGDCPPALEAPPGGLGLVGNAVVGGPAREEAAATACATGRDTRRAIAFSIFAALVLGGFAVGGALATDRLRSEPWTPQRRVVAIGAALWIVVAAGGLVPVSVSMEWPKCVRQEALAPMSPVGVAAGDRLPSESFSRSASPRGTCTTDADTLATVATTLDGTSTPSPGPHDVVTASVECGRPFAAARVGGPGGAACREVRTARRWIVGMSLLTIVAATLTVAVWRAERERRDRYHAASLGSPAAL